MSMETRGLLKIRVMYEILNMKTCSNTDDRGQIKSEKKPLGHLICRRHSCHHQG